MKESNLLEELLAGILVIGVLIISIPFVVLDGYVLSVLWGWFISPLFNLPALSIINAIMITAIVRFITIPPTEHKKTENPVTHFVVSLIVRPTFILLVGWILHFYV